MAIPPQRGLFGVARSVVGWTVGTVAFVVVLPARIAALLTEIELLLVRVSQVVDGAARIVDQAELTVVRVDGTIGKADATVAKADATVSRVDRTITQAEATVVRIDGTITKADATVGTADVVAARANDLVGSTGLTSTQAQELLDLYRPIALRLRPMAEQLVSSISEQEVQATIKLVDQLPQLVEHLESDIMPILVTLDRVGPDVQALLDVVRDLREAAIGIPGFRFFRKRGEHLIDPKHKPEDPA